MFADEQFPLIDLQTQQAKPYPNLGDIISLQANARSNATRTTHGTEQPALPILRRIHVPLNPLIPIGTQLALSIKHGMVQHGYLLIQLRHTILQLQLLPVTISVVLDSMMNPDVFQIQDLAALPTEHDPKHGHQHGEHAM